MQGHMELGTKQIWNSCSVQQQRKQLGILVLQGYKVRSVEFYAKS